MCLKSPEKLPTCGSWSITSASHRSPPARSSLGARRAARAAELPNVFAKLSGLDAGGAQRWIAADITPYVDRALELFGPERLMFGSDWPVANLRGGYGKVWNESNLLLARLSRDERDRILGGTAMAFYRLPISAMPPAARLWSIGWQQPRSGG
jgi:predicted TIM-barrel fold metal-dependent hydrolase